MVFGEEESEIREWYDFKDVKKKWAEHFKRLLYVDEDKIVTVGTRTGYMLEIDES